MLRTSPPRKAQLTKLVRQGIYVRRSSCPAYKSLIWLEESFLYAEKQDLRRYSLLKYRLYLSNFVTSALFPLQKYLSLVMSPSHKQQCQAFIFCAIYYICTFHPYNLFLQNKVFFVLRGPLITKWHAKTLIVIILKIYLI